MNKYEIIANEIEKDIHDNQLPQGTKLQNLEQLMHKYNVSKSTITKALDTLEKRGAIFQQRGSGIFVRRQRREGYVSLLTNRGFTEELKEFNISSEVIQLKKIKADEEVRTNLHLKIDDEVYFVERLRRMDQDILCVETSYFPVSLVPYLNIEIAQGSIFNYLTNALKFNIKFADIYMHIDELNEDYAQKLELKPGNPALFLEQVVYLATGEPFDFSKITYHYKHSKFFVQATNY
ncbi:GntR family transcriptional regulator [Macrococcoides caseolyticum]|uniref:GntR family transcriptional regulator n=1 Tax=Macrococcoides caseolyticum TaxID=69966 RepID=UPI001F3ADBAA|nr:GntR family transcriptional regulator [Macrococcus caseolyticus]MCE4955987.1 GntR family transcriptional regulator [Macrococcus caseolyticus]